MTPTPCPARRRASVAARRGPAHPHRRGATSTTSSLPGMLHAAFVRSPFAHARDRAASTSARRGAARRRRRAHRAPTSSGDVAPDSGARSDPGPTAPVFARARRRTRCASSATRSRSSSPRAATSPRTRASWSRSTTSRCPGRDMDARARPGAPAALRRARLNVVYTRRARRYGDVDAAFAEADRVVARAVRPAPARERADGAPRRRRRLRPRHRRRSTYHAATRRRTACACALAALPRACRPTGCGCCAATSAARFGQKVGVDREDVAVCAAAALARAPVKWIEDRSENLIAAGQAREETLDVAGGGHATTATSSASTSTMRARPGRLPGRPARPRVHRASSGRMSRRRTASTAMRWSSRRRRDRTRRPTSPYRGPWAAETLGARAADRPDRPRARPRSARGAAAQPRCAPDEQPRQMITGPTLEGVDRARDARARRSSSSTSPRFRERAGRARERGPPARASASPRSSSRRPGRRDFCGRRSAFPIGSERACARLEPDGTSPCSPRRCRTGRATRRRSPRSPPTSSACRSTTSASSHGDTHVVAVQPDRHRRVAVGDDGQRRRAARRPGPSRRRCSTSPRDLLEIDADDLEIVDGASSVKGAPEPRRSARRGRRTRLLRAAALPAERRRRASRRRPRRRRRAGGWSGGTHCCIVEVDPETGRRRRSRATSSSRTAARSSTPRSSTARSAAASPRASAACCYEHARLRRRRPASSPARSWTTSCRPRLRVPRSRSSTSSPSRSTPSRLPRRRRGRRHRAPAAVVNAVVDALGGGRGRVLPLTPDRVLELLDAAGTPG